MPHARVQAAIEAFARGEMIVVTDDDDRENEGDLFVAASLCTPDKMAFIIRHTSGIVCAPLPRAEAQRLRLDPMVSSNDAPLGTAFTVTVDVKHGLTTGISSEERTNTVRALANGNSGASDFVRPGHVFPLIAREGGVLTRTGHTEACVDFCIAAGLPPVGVLAELVNDSGSVMRGPEVTAFAQAHGLAQASIAELIAWRQSREKLVERVATFTVDTVIGKVTAHAYKTPFDAVHHLAFVHGSVGDGKDVPTRLHRADVVRDIFGGAPGINIALEYFKREGKGVLVYLRDGTEGVPATAMVDNEATASEAARLQQWREVGVGAQILRDLGCASIKLVTRSDPKRFVGLSGFGITITGLAEV